MAEISEAVGRFFERRERQRKENLLRALQQREQEREEKKQVASELSALGVPAEDLLRARKIRERITRKEIGPKEPGEEEALKELGEFERRVAGKITPLEVIFDEKTGQFIPVPQGARLKVIAKEKIIKPAIVTKISSQISGLSNAELRTRRKNLEILAKPTQEEQEELFQLTNESRRRIGLAPLKIPEKKKTFAEKVGGFFRKKEIELPEGMIEVQDVNTKRTKVIPKENRALAEQRGLKIIRE